MNIHDKMKRTSYHDGASAERQAIRRKVQRMIKDLADCDPIELMTLLEWITQRHARYTKRHGGL